jgi:hypothetical protein
MIGPLLPDDGGTAPPVAHDPENPIPGAAGDSLGRALLEASASDAFVSFLGAGHSYKIIPTRRFP